MKKFKIPSIPPTTNKSIRFPNDIITEVEQVIHGQRLYVYSLCRGGGPGSAGKFERRLLKKRRSFDLRFFMQSNVI